MKKKLKNRWFKIQKKKLAGWQSVTFSLKKHKHKQNKKLYVVVVLQCNAYVVAVVAVAE